MKKIICTLVLCFFISITAFADNYKIGDTNYYYNDDTMMIEYTDSNGKSIEKGPYSVTRPTENGIEGTTQDSFKKGIPDMNLNEVIPAEYDDIYFNKNNNTYRCVVKEPGRIDFYDSDFNKISQPLDISPIDTTNYYMLTVYDESSGEEKYYICDEYGNKLIDEGFKALKSGDKTIIAITDSDKKGVYNNELELVIPFEYDSIWYNKSENVYHCKKNGEDIIYNSDFSPLASGLNILYGSSYYYKKENDGLFYICDHDGNILKNKGYYDINGIGEGFFVRSKDTYPRLYGLLDKSFNEVTEEKYYRMGVSEDENEILCYLDENIDVYDSDFKLKEKRKSDLTFVKALEGMEDRFIYNSSPDNDMNAPYSCIIDSKGNILSNMYTSIQPKVYPGGTLIVESPAGHSDTESSVLDSEFNVIAGPSFGYMYVKEENDAIYIENVWTGSDTKYYDLYGNQYKTKAEVIAAAQTHGEASAWAKDSITKAIEAGIVPEEIRSQYIRKITRQEFCKLAVMTYISKTNYTIADNSESPFGDVNDSYVTTAYDLNIVAGRGNGIFAPKDSITRQEAAVMLNNLAKLLNIEGTEKTDKFVDESYFADWAKDAIYSVASMKSGDTYVMAGTGEGKFSPWMNYTREQAIATMLRLYNCNDTDAAENKGTPIYFQYSYPVGIKYYIAKIDETGNNFENIISEEQPVSIEKITNNRVYYSGFNNSENYLGYIDMDTSNINILLSSDDITDFYIGTSNIYYINKNDSVSQLIKSDMGGNTLKKVTVPENQSASICSEKGNEVYLSIFPTVQQVPSEPEAFLYKCDFNTESFTQADEVNGISFSNSSIAIGNYKYYKVQTSKVSYGIFRSDIDGDNEEIFYALNVAKEEPIYSNKEKIYTIVAEDGLNIAEINENREAKKITEYTDYGFDLHILDIRNDNLYYLKIDDNKKEIHVISLIDDSDIITTTF